MLAPSRLANAPTECTRSPGLLSAQSESCQKPKEMYGQYEVRRKRKSTTNGGLLASTSPSSPSALKSSPKQSGTLESEATPKKKVE